MSAGSEVAEAFSYSDLEGTDIDAVVDRPVNATIESAAPLIEIDVAFLERRP